jgi:hypothetical protein
MDDHQSFDDDEDELDDLFDAQTAATVGMDDAIIHDGFPHDVSDHDPFRGRLIGNDHTGFADEGHVADLGAEEHAENAADESYWSLSRAPLESLVFTLPLVFTYELGVLFLGRGTPRNGADVWLRGFLDSLGFGAYFFLLPSLTILGLAAWHHVEHERWRFRGRVLVGMACESILLACVLIGLAHLQEDLWPGAMDDRVAMSSLDTGLFSPSSSMHLQRLVGYCGAGLYEEVLFRLLLLPALAWGLARLGFGTFFASAGAVVVSALLFSGAHYVGIHGEDFDFFSFTFRAMAGVFFGCLFLVRGFGISAGTHAVYDVLVGLV